VPKNGHAKCNIWLSIFRKFQETLLTTPVLFLSYRLKFLFLSAPEEIIYTLLNRFMIHSCIRCIILIHSLPSLNTHQKIRFDYQKPCLSLLITDCILNVTQTSCIPYSLSDITLYYLSCINNDWWIVLFCSSQCWKDLSKPLKSQSLYALAFSSCKYNALRRKV
jgi:hypothetical protein